MSQPAIALHAVFNRAELRRVRYRLFFMSTQGKFLIAVIALGIIAAADLAWTTGTWAAPLVMSILWALVISRAFGRGLTSLLNEPKVVTPADPIIYEISARGIALSTSKGEQMLLWPRITRVVTLPEGFVLYIQKGALFVSNAWFPDAAARGQFVDMMRANVSPQALPS